MGLQWHLNRCAELEGIIDRAAADDFTLDSSAQTPDQTAAEVVSRWLG